MRGLIAAGGPSDTLTQAQFAKLSAFIHRVAGIKMPPSKHAMVEGRLRRRVAATGAGSFAKYCAAVFHGGDDGEEVVNLIDAITTNKTDFFREPQHFDLLTRTILPGMDTAQQPLKVWSSACSIGAEPYTLAIVLSEYRQAQNSRFLPMPPPLITATDLCTTVLRTAREGIYPEDMIAPIPPELRKRYLLRARASADRSVRISPALRAMVQFGQLNLMAPAYPLGRDFDIVFCRNVLIYFDRADQLAVLGKLCGHLRTGGVLALGHSESIHNFDLPLVPIGQTMFRKLP
jgi:chemotaxis protein methyltransferase CheR